ncbi:MAG: hypothetical protein EA403_07640 [Spirochaetaceae bacterium]|nr:MAG: hypothetical protein EA403_07640 [Spirochaetaceae bacterium]
MNFDADQRSAIAVVRNAVVSAGAGSGKTTVLAERYLELVRDRRTPVDRILTLTFTRKAAAEMHERIFRRLSQITDDPFVTEQLARFDRAVISTLDSFCGQLVRGSAARFGVSPDFRTDEDEHRQLAEQVALEVLLERVHTEAVGRFVAANSFETVWHDCLVSIAENWCVITRPVDAAALARTQQEALREAFAGELERVVAAIDSTAALAFDGSGKSVETAREVMARLSAIDLAQMRGAVNLDTLDQLEAALLGVRLPGGKTSDPDIIAYKECIATTREALTLLQTIVLSIRMEPEIRALLEMVQGFDDRLQAAKRAAGLLSYADVMEMAIATLRGDASLRAYYGKRFRFIMIDEFQDNNERQKILLYLLSLNDVAGEELATSDRMPTGADLQPDKLFFVGDDKQSIYRFRGADVSVFRTLAGELSGGLPEPIELSHNYRSQPVLIDFFNHLFPRVMGEAEHTYEAAFSPLVAGAPAVVDSTVTLFYKPFVPAGSGEDDDEESLRNEDVEAFRVAEWIASVVRDRSLPVRDAAEANARAAGYDDFAVLFRSTGNQMRYERMFRRFGIPYQSQSVRSLFLEAPASDLYQLVQLACHPFDRLAYAALLRSPLVHLDDDALVTVLLQQNEPFAEAGLRGEQAARYAAGAELFAWLGERIDRVPHSRLLTEIWYDRGYRYALLRNSSYHPYLDYAEQLFAFVRRFDDRPAVELLEQWREQLGQGERVPDLEVIQEHDAGVKLMTIHASKGLEFPVVILANSGNRGRQEGTGSAPCYVSEQYGLTFNLPPDVVSEKPKVNWFFTQGKDEEQARSLAEVKRLLYVALTRAESHLGISGYHHASNRNTEHVHLNMVLNALGIPPGPPSDDEASTASAGGHPAVTVRYLSDVPQSELFRNRERGLTVDAPLATRRYAELPLVSRVVARREFSATDLNALSRDIPPAAGVEAGRALPALPSDGVIRDRRLEAAFGTLCHLAIELRLRGGNEGEELRRRLEERAPDDLRAELTERAFRQVLQDAQELSGRFFASPECARLVAPARGRVEVEHAIVLRPRSAPDILVHGQIDLFVPNPDGTGGSVIDFKTNAHVEPDEYRVQLALYREAAEAIFGSPVGAWVCYLRGPLWVDYTAAVAEGLATLIVSVPPGR